MRSSVLQAKAAQPCASIRLIRQRVSQRLARPPIGALVSQALDLAGSEEKETEKPVEEEFEDEGADEGTGLSTQQVQSMLSVLCEETDIAELDLKMGSFELSVRRSMKGSETSPVATAVVAHVHTSPAAPVPAAQPAPSPTGSGQSMDEDDVLESLVPITAPKVGILRRGRYIKGKKVGKGALAAVGDKVKKGQTLAFIEQLGTFIPVEAPQAGEVAEFVVDEGAAVEYNEVVIELAPFFGGHIIGDSKYA